MHWVLKSSCPSRHFFRSCLILAQNLPTTQYTQISSESSSLTMDSSTPARTNNPNTCHNTSVPEDPSPPVLPPSSALLRSRSQRLNGASSIQQEEASHHSSFIAPSSLPTRRTHTTPVRVRPVDDESRKRKTVCTPTRPTAVPNEVSTPSTRPLSRPRVANPYLKTVPPNAFVADTSSASTPQLIGIHIYIYTLQVLTKSGTSMH